MRVGVEADDGGVGEKVGDAVVRAVRVEKSVVDAGRQILLEAADGFRGAQDGLADAAGIELDERAVAFLDFDDAILNGHRAEDRLFAAGQKAERMRRPAERIAADTPFGAAGLTFGGASGRDGNERCRQNSGLKTVRLELQLNWWLMTTLYRQAGRTASREKHAAISSGCGRRMCSSTGFVKT